MDQAAVRFVHIQQITVRDNFCRPSLRLCHLIFGIYGPILGLSPAFCDVIMPTRGDHDDSAIVHPDYRRIFANAGG
jgi:hypothetical protein